MNTLWIGCQLGKSDYSVNVVLAWIWDPVEDVRRAVINTARRLCCRDDECAVNTFLQHTISRSFQRPKVIGPWQGFNRFLWVQLWRWKLRTWMRTWLFEVASRRRDRIAGSCPRKLVNSLVFAVNKSDDHRVAVISALRESSNERSQMSVNQHCKD